ncbi:MAG: nucleoside-diphosphate-sugar epimerase, partial [Limisphaerales bacterium]
MKVIITGGGGFLGSQLATTLLDHGKLTGPSGKPEPIDAMVLIDAHFPVPLNDPRLVVDLQQRKGLQKMGQIVGDISNRDVIDEAIGSAKNIS